MYMIAGVMLFAVVALVMGQHAPLLLRRCCAEQAGDLPHSSRLSAIQCDTVQLPVAASLPSQVKHPFSC